jgi:pyruvate/2-oxoglutarate dehydrogenase complex dihydrolipoamide dehydrogenase (E3) component
MKKNYDFDVAVIGGGAAGLFAAETLIGQGARTCLVEQEKLGGDCTWYGCIPSKTLLKTAKTAQQIRNAGMHGLEPGETGPDSSRVMHHVDDIRNRIGDRETPEIMREKGIEVLPGSASFTASDTFRIGKRNFRARRFIIATGSRAAVPGIRGLEEVDYLTNETFFGMKELPPSMLVLGGGPVGIELAQAAARLGVSVTVAEMTDHILAMEDEEIAQLVEKRLREEGLDIRTGTRAVEVRTVPEGIAATLEGRGGERRQVTAAKLLLAVGRTPNTAGLCLGAAGVEYTDGGISVNDYLQTTNPIVFACGDVVGPYLFTHTAAYQAYICTRNALFRRMAWKKVNYDTIAWADFIDPEVAHLGLTEQQAREKHGSIKVYRTAYAEADRAWTDSAREGLVKVITDSRGYILGAHIAGEQAAEIIHPLAVAMEKKIKLAQLAQITFIYPTLSELVRKTAAKPLEEFLSRWTVRAVLRLLRKI